MPITTIMNNSPDKLSLYPKNSLVNHNSWLNLLLFVMCIIWCSYQLWTAYIPFAAFYQRSIHFLFNFILVFMTLDLQRKDERYIEARLRWDGLILSLLTIICIVYAFATWSEKAFIKGTEVPTQEIILGFTFFFITIEACRRAVGWTIPIMTLLLMFYARFGEALPPVLAHPNYSFERMVISFYISMDGIMGYLAHISTTFIFIFVVFGAFLRVSGGGDFFIKLAQAILGHVRGGPAKIAVIASALFGTVSGSAVANTAGTGQFTIPLMKQCGYPPHFAAGVEATASAGGQIMPPVLGGAAFIMCEVLGVSYIFIIKSILIISLLYFISIFVMVDIEAQKLGLIGLPRKELPSLWRTLKEGWFFLFPPIILLFLLAIVRYSATLAALYATFSMIVFSWFGKDARMGPRKILKAMEEACYTFRAIGGVLACAGLLVGLINMTGLGLMLGTILIELSHGMLPLLLILTMFSSVILGMGMPITATYVILSIIVAPALIKMGVTPIASHLFIFYFGVFSDITPPFCPNAFVASGIAEAPLMKTAFSACKIGLIGIILPYMMIYNKEFLSQGSFIEIAGVFVTAILGIICLGSAINGFLFRKINVFLRFCLFAAAISLIIPGIATDFFGLGIFLAIAWIQKPKFYVDIIKKYFGFIFAKSSL